MKRLLILSLPYLLSAGLTSASTVDTVAGTGHSELNLYSGALSELNIKDPFSVEFGPDCLLYVTEVGHHRILRCDLELGIARTIAGAGNKGFTGDGGPAVKGTFKGPKGIIDDAKQENVFVVDTENQAIRRIHLPSNRISSLAGYGPKCRGYNGEGVSATKAKFGRPHGICIGPDDAIYTENHRVRRVQWQ